jgi:hypothetical protein
MIRMLTRHAGLAALALALLALVFSWTGAADAARKKFTGAGSTKPKPYGLLRLDKKGRFPAKAIPKVRAARRADRLGGRTARQLTDTCDAQTVDLGTWCLQASPYPVPNEDVGKNDYFYAGQACVEAGGFLPTAAQLIGAAARVKLSSTIDDEELTASVDNDATDGLKDRREMSGTLVTTQAGSSAAGSEGVSDGAKGDPKAGEPDPVPQPANPSPETLQYVTVYDNRDRGGFAGSKPVGQPEAFRCGFSKAQGSGAQLEG